MCQSLPKRDAPNRVLSFAEHSTVSKTVVSELERSASALSRTSFSHSRRTLLDERLFFRVLLAPNRLTV